MSIPTFEKGWYKVPNGWTDSMSQITTIGELKVIEYIMRRTYGYGSYSGGYEPITMDEFQCGRNKWNGEKIDKGTGLTECQVRKGLASALRHFHIEACEIEGSDAYGYRILHEGANHKPQKKMTRQESLDRMTYDQYLRTPEWKKKRTEALEAGNYRCALCGVSHTLNVHHSSYEDKRGQEQLKNLTVLCEEHHHVYSEYEKKKVDMTKVGA